MNIQCNLNEKFSLLGYGSMHIRDRIYDPSPEMRIDSRVTQDDKDILYPPYTDLIWVPGNCDRGYWPGKMEDHSINILTLHNVVFSTECVIIKPNGYHTFKHECHPRYWNIGLPYHTPYIEYEKYDRVICIGHQHTCDWGHRSIEVLPAIIALPEEYKINSYIALPFAYDYVVDNLMAIGIQRWQILDGDNKRYYANTFFTVESRWCGDLNRYIVVNMKQFFSKKFNLENISSYRYVLYNREKGMSRRISNFDDLVQAVKANITEYKWEVGETIFNIEEASKYFASIKLFFAVHGAIIANEIYMRVGSVVIELQMESWLLSYVFLGPMTGIIQIEGRDCSISYRSKEENKVDIDYCVSLIKTGVKYTHNS